MIKLLGYIKDPKNICIVVLIIAIISTAIYFQKSNTTTIEKYKSQLTELNAEHSSEIHKLDSISIVDSIAYEIKYSKLQESLKEIQHKYDSAYLAQREWTNTTTETTKTTHTDGTVTENTKTNTSTYKEQESIIKQLNETLKQNEKLSVSLNVTIDSLKKELSVKKTDTVTKDVIKYVDKIIEHEKIKIEYTEYKWNVYGEGAGTHHPLISF